MSRERVAIRPHADTEGARRAVLERGRQRGFRTFVLRAGDPASGAAEELTIREESGSLRAERAGASPVPVVRVESEADLARALLQVPDAGTLAIEWTADRVIPLENAVAIRGRRFALWVVAHGPSEVPGALGALEHGADLVIVDVHSPGEVDALEAMVEAPGPSYLEWRVVPLTGVGPAGLGDRVIVDTTSLLAAEEGLLIGSAAGFLFHVASEAVGSRFSRPRPFRVNAGAAHSYVLLADGSTRYLAELGPGDAVLAVTPEGTARSVRVGRIKVERRPLVVLTARDGDASRTLFVQEAESVRVSTTTGRVPTTEIRVGANVHGVRLPAARHLGRAVDETIEER